MKYVHTIKIRGAPSLPNRSHGHWSKIERERKIWHKLVAESILFKPTLPITQARVTCIRATSRKCDYDGLVYSFKAVIDGLVNCFVLRDDDMFTITERHYAWRKVPEKEKYIQVTVEEL